MPILEDVSTMSDSGTPFVLTLPESVPIVSLFDEIAKRVDHEVKNLKPNTWEVNYDPMSSKIILQNDGKTERELDPYEVRIKCKCAGCIDEVDGHQILKVG